MKSRRKSGKFSKSLRPRAIRVIAPSTPVHACLQQSRWRPTPRFCAADAERSAPSPLACRRALSLARPLGAHVKVYCRMRRAVETFAIGGAPSEGYGQRLGLAESISQRGLTCQNTDEAINFYSARLRSCRAAAAGLRRGFMPQGPTPWFYAVTVETYVGAAA